MPCRFPEIRRNKTGGKPYPVSCRKCFGCRMSAREVLVRNMTFEVLSCYSQGFSPSFVTFTYDDKHLPRDGSLHVSELESLRKRMYQNLRDRHLPQPRQGFKYLLVGEYGDSFGRCHLHGCFPSVGSSYAEFFADAWQGRGSVKVLPLLQGGIRYCLKYMDKHQKEYDELYVANGLEPPMKIHSTKLGFDYYSSHQNEIREREGLYWNGHVHYMDYYARKQYNIGSSPQDYTAMANIAHQHDESLGEYMRNQSWLAEYASHMKSRENNEPVDSTQLWQEKDMSSDWFNYLDAVYDADYSAVHSSRSYDLLESIFETEETL